MVDDRRRTRGRGRQAPPSGSSPSAPAPTGASATTSRTDGTTARSSRGRSAARRPVIPRPVGPSRKATRSATSDGSSMPLDRVPLDHRLAARAPATCALGERRAHERRADGGRRDPDLRPFERERLHEAEHAVLRRDVARLERRRGQRVRGGDHADAAVAGGGERLPRVLREQERRGEQQREQRGPTAPPGSRAPARRAGSRRSGRSRRAGRARRARRRRPRGCPSRVVRSASSTSTPCTVQPSASSRSTIAAPIPPRAPVTSATLASA